MKKLTKEQADWVINEIELAAPFKFLIADPQIDIDKYCFLMAIAQIINQCIGEDDVI